MKKIILGLSFLSSFLFSSCNEHYITENNSSYVNQFPTNYSLKLSLFPTELDKLGKSTEMLLDKIADFFKVFNDPKSNHSYSELSRLSLFQLSTSVKEDKDIIEKIKTSLNDLCKVHTTLNLLFDPNNAKLLKIEDLPKLIKDLKILSSSNTLASRAPDTQKRIQELNSCLSNLSNNLDALTKKRLGKDESKSSSEINIPQMKIIPIRNFYPSKKDTITTEKYSLKSQGADTSTQRFVASMNRSLQAEAIRLSARQTSIGLGFAKTIGLGFAKTIPSKIFKAAAETATKAYLNTPQGTKPKKKKK